MRTQIALQCLLVTSLVSSTISAVAQTGEFASPVQGRVMRDAWDLQDQLQKERNGTPVQPANPFPAGPYYGDPNSVKPAVGGATIRNGKKSQE
jgi:hypothetical protein